MRRSDWALLIIAGLLAIALVWYVAGALPQPITNDDIIRETKKCKDAGMGARLDSAEVGPLRVVCIPDKLF